MGVAGFSSQGTYWIAQIVKVQDGWPEQLGLSGGVATQWPYFNK